MSLCGSHKYTGEGAQAQCRDRKLRPKHCYIPVGVAEIPLARRHVFTAPGVLIMVSRQLTDPLRPDLLHNLLQLPGEDGHHLLATRLAQGGHAVHE